MLPVIILVSSRCNRSQIRAEGSCTLAPSIDADEVQWQVHGQWQLPAPTSRLVVHSPLIPADAALSMQAPVRTTHQGDAFIFEFDAPAVGPVELRGRWTEALTWSSETGRAFVEVPRWTETFGMGVTCRLLAAVGHDVIAVAELPDWQPESEISQLAHRTALHVGQPGRVDQSFTGKPANGGRWQRSPWNWRPTRPWTCS